MKKTQKKGALVMLLLLTALALGAFLKNGEPPMKLTYSEFQRRAERGEIASVTVSEKAEWTAIFPTGETVLFPNPRTTDGKEKLLLMGLDVREESASAIPGAVMAALLLFGMALLLWNRKTGEKGMMKYAAVQPETNVPDVTFADVGIQEETLRAMRDLTDFLRNPEAFRKVGARPPKGVMLYGPPGTGKTLLARALAGEAKAPFFAMSGADFVQVYVGVGASRVRELFKKARKAGGGVIFIDEIDAIGKKRDSGNEEREQTLNALLTEMSGFSGGDGIMVLAATNRLETLDPALLREGRFDRRIEVGLPDAAQREKILRVHAKSKPLEPAVDLCTLARQTVLFSGAQLETLLNEAAIRAARKGKAAIGPGEIEEAFLAVAAGEDSPRPMTAQEKRITAYHEAGHALVTRLMLPGALLQRVTIIPSARGAAGYSMSIPEEKTLHTKKELYAMICAALAGRAAEETVFGPDDVTTGASGDLKKASDIAVLMAGEWGMGATGDPEQDKKAIGEACMEMARQCVSGHLPALHRLASALLEKESLSGDEVCALIAG